MENTQKSLVTFNQQTDLLVNAFKLDEVTNAQQAVSIANSLAGISEWNNLAIAKILEKAKRENFHTAVLDEKKKEYYKSFSKWVLDNFPIALGLTTKQSIDGYVRIARYLDNNGFDNIEREIVIIRDENGNIIDTAQTHTKRFGKTKLLKAHETVAAKGYVLISYEKNENSGKFEKRIYTTFDVDIKKRIQTTFDADIDIDDNYEIMFINEMKDGDEKENVIEKVVRSLVFNGVIHSDNDMSVKEMTKAIEKYFAPVKSTDETTDETTDEITDETTNKTTDKTTDETTDETTSEKQFSIAFTRSQWALIGNLLENSTNSDTNEIVEKIRKETQKQDKKNSK